MSSPNSFCFITTYNSCHELIGMLLSLSLQHPGSNVYGFVDIESLNALNSMNPKIKLNLYLNTCLNKYSNKNRQNMVIEGIWDEFQMQKAEVIRYALKTENDTMFLDSDILFFNPINIIDKTKEIGVSPHFTKKSNTDEVGYYNGGCLWTKNKNVPDDWIEFTKTSRYHDQASIEDLAKKYSYQEFGEEINYMPWRIIVGENIDLEVKKIIDKSYDRAKKVLTEKIDDLHKLAKALLIYETLTGDEIRDLILKNVKPTRSYEDDNKDQGKDSSALDSLGLKPKPAI